MLVDKETNKPTKIKIMFSEGRKLRISKESGKAIFFVRPEKKSKRPLQPTVFDTPKGLARMRTYDPLNDFNTIMPLKYQKKIEKKKYVPKTIASKRLVEKVIALQNAKKVADAAAASEALRIAKKKKRAEKVKTLHKDNGAKKAGLLVKGKL